MAYILSLHDELISLLSRNVQCGVGFKIEQILKQDEQQVIKQGIASLAVEPANLHQILRYHKEYFRDTTLSTLFVDRMPGFIVVPEKQNTIIALCNEINAMKKHLLSLINTPERDKYQRHDYMHSLFPRIMTDQFRRKIHYTTSNVSVCYFNFTARPVPKTFSIEKATQYIESLKDKPKNLFTETEWTNVLDDAIAFIRKGNFKHIEIEKELKVLPILTYKEVVDGVTKTKTMNANTPFLLLGQKNNHIPKYTALKDYVRQTNQPKTRSKKKKQLISSYLNLLGVTE
jgi:hypothetical protein